MEVAGDPVVRTAVLLTCDEALREFLLFVHNEEKSFILRELDDTHMLVKRDLVEWLRARIDRHQDENTYQQMVMRPDIERLA